MATPTPRRAPATPVRPELEVVDAGWLLRAIGLTLAVAVALAYLTICLLVRYGAWQRVLHPVAAITTVPSVPYTAVDFDAGATGTPRLNGWWIDSAQPAAGTPTLLYLHDGTGSLSSSAAELDQLHGMGANLFAFDYRGFGRSGSEHPTEAHMQQDAEAALDYLIHTRHLAAAGIVPYGKGVGAALAAHLAQSHPELPGLIVEDPDPELRNRLLADSRNRLLPVGLLIEERFDVAGPLTSFARPKLLLSGAADRQQDRRQAVETLYRAAPPPKVAVTFGAAPDPARQRVEAVHRFLDQTVLPNPAP